MVEVVRTLTPSNMITIVYHVINFIKYDGRRYGPINIQVVFVFQRI